MTRRIAVTLLALSAAVCSGQVSPPPATPNTCTTSGCALANPTTATTQPPGTSNTTVSSTAYADAAVVAARPVVPLYGINGGVGVSGSVAFSISGTTNRVGFVGFQIPYKITSANFAYRVATADNTANLYNIGIYSISGTVATKVAELTATAGSTLFSGTGVFTKAWSAPVTLNPGQYVLATATNCASACAAVVLPPIASVLYYSYAAAGIGASSAALPPTIDLTLNTASYTSTSPMTIDLIP